MDGLPTSPLSGRKVRSLKEEEDDKAVKSRGW